MKIAFRIVAFFLICLSAGAGEKVHIERINPAAQAAERNRIAKTLYTHSFENVRDPETGLLLPQSAALGVDQWPDFWEPIRAVGFPEYLIPTVRVVAEGSGYIAGAYRNLANSVLRMDFDGTKVGVRTRIPVAIDPALTYEYSALVRDTDMDGARIQIGVEWLRIDPASVQLLRSDSVPNLNPGQADWPAQPNRMLINTPPPEANAARFFIIADRDPESVGGTYQGSLWVDNITLTPLPRIRIESPQFSDGEKAPYSIPVRYTGLFDNIPVPANPGYFKGRSYSRRVDIFNIFGQPVTGMSGQHAAVVADADGVAVEEVTFPRDTFGVYYFNIRLYGMDQELLTNVTRAGAIMPPEPAVRMLGLRSRTPAFGVNVGMIPETILGREGMLRSVLVRSGAAMIKIALWRDSYTGERRDLDYYTTVAEVIKSIKPLGLGTTGVIRPPEAIFGEPSLQHAVSQDPERLGSLLSEAGHHFGLLMDHWQWGSDADGSLSWLPPGATLNNLVGTLHNFAGGLPVAGTVILDGSALLSSPMAVNIVQVFLPSAQRPEQLWSLSAPIIPWLFAPYYRERGTVYPPASLSRLAPPPPGDRLEEEARMRQRRTSWVALEPVPAYANEPNLAAERMQLEDLMQRAIYAATLSPEVIYLGELFNPTRGLLRRETAADGTLETMVRPIFFAASTLSHLLEGAEYLGQLWLLPPLEAHAFRRPDSDESIIAVWHNSDVRDEILLSRKEIANGPALELIDWAGNRSSTPSSIRIRKVPVFIRGLSANLLLTRMSMRISPEQPMLAINRRQNQSIEIVNHLSQQVPVSIRLRYAARMPGGTMENNWTVKPDALRLNLAPRTQTLAAERVRYSATPDANSQIQVASTNGSGDASGGKIAQAEVSFSTSPPADMTVYLPFQLSSDIDVEITALERVDDPLFITLQLKLRWFPAEAERRRGDIKLRPYYVKYGRMKESLAFPIAVKAVPKELRGNANAPFESAELRIPRQPQARTWIGLDEVGGGSFYIADVTEFILGE